MEMSNRVVRTANYSQAKKSTLLDLVDKQRFMVENKTDDFTTECILINKIANQEAQ